MSLGFGTSTCMKYEYDMTNSTFYKAIATIRKNNKINSISLHLFQFYSTFYGSHKKSFSHTTACYSSLPCKRKFEIIRLIIGLGY